MTPPVFNRVRLLLPVVLLTATVVCILPARADDKLKPEEVVAKHLESIGTAEARASRQRHENQRKLLRCG